MVTGANKRHRQTTKEDIKTETHDLASYNTAEQYLSFAQMLGKRSIDPQPQQHRHFQWKLVCCHFQLETGSVSTGAPRR
jgi:hypothetical protein